MKNVNNIKKKHKINKNFNKILYKIYKRKLINKNNKNKKFN